MKIGRRHYYFISSPVKISDEHRWALSRGIAHVHGNPIRKPLIRWIVNAEKNNTAVEKEDASEHETSARTEGESEA